MDDNHWLDSIRYTCDGVTLSDKKIKIDQPPYVIKPSRGTVYFCSTQSKQGDTVVDWLFDEDEDTFFNYDEKTNFSDNQGDEMDPTQWMYSPVHNKFKHIHTSREFSPETFYMWFPNYDDVEKCDHEWESMLLLTSTVFNCKKCNKTKEHFDEQKNKRLSTNRCGKS